MTIQGHSLAMIIGTRGGSTRGLVRVPGIGDSVQHTGVSPQQCVALSFIMVCQAVKANGCSGCQAANATCAACQAYEAASRFLAQLRSCFDFQSPNHLSLNACQSFEVAKFSFTQAVKAIGPKRL